jgi:hypothetical protein
MSIIVRVYGVLPRRPELEAAFADEFDETVAFVDGDPTDDVNSRAVWGSDLILCGFDANSPGDGKDLFKLLVGVIKSYGAWSYLPQIILGAPADPAVANKLERLAASRYLRADHTPKTIAWKAKNTWRATWWHAERSRDFPVLMVNRDGIVERANPCAVQRFGPLVGARYSEAVEGRAPGVPLPDEHPILRALPPGERREDRRGKNISVEHKFCRPAEEEVRFFFICTPVALPSGRARAAAVSLLDMTRWSRLVEALNAFDEVLNTSDGEGRRRKFEREIVVQANRLRFARVRLYQLVETGDPQKDRLNGRDEIGLKEPGRHEYFCNEFSTPRATDNTTPITLDDKKYACLYIHGTGDDTGLSRHQPGELPYRVELEREGVERWIEGPIFLPSEGEGQLPTPWGKLSLDQGKESGNLDVRDVGDVAVFCSIVGHSLGVLRRLEREETQNTRLQRLSTDLVAAIKPDEQILAASIERILRLVLEVTGGDIALYRRFDDQLRHSLRQIGEAEFKDPAVEPFLEIPNELSRNLEGYFLHFEEGEFGSKSVYPVKNPKARLRQFACTPDAPELTPGNWAYLEFIESELHIPVFRGTTVVGVIVVVANRADAFSPSLLPRVEALVHAISLGIESARRHDDSLLMGQALQRTTRLLSKLASIPPNRNDQFFAALATLLSAGAGLRWNRVFVFDCHHDKAPPNTTELVYALGGLATSEGVVAHKVLQELFRWDKRFAELSALVDERIAHPEPHYRFSEQAKAREPVLDAVFDLCITRTQEDPKRRIFVIPAEPDEVVEPPPSEPKRIEETNPLGSLLRMASAGELPEECDPLTIKVNELRRAGTSGGGQGPIRNHWVRELNGPDNYPGIFDESKKMFAFLLRGGPEEENRPLGVVLVGMQSIYEVDESDMVAATRTLLRLASNLLADRYHRRGNYGNINSLHARNHGPGDLRAWKSLVSTLIDQWTRFRVRFAADPLLEDRLGEVVAALDPEFEEDERRGLEFAGKLGDFNARMERRGGEKLLVIENLGDTLRDWESYFSGQDDAEVDFRILGLDAKLDRRVPCDPLVLRDAIGALIDNTKEVYDQQKGEKRRLTATLRVALVPTNCTAMPEVVVLSYEDDGIEIPPEVRDCIMLYGYSTAEIPDKRGRGLPIVMRQLLEYHGHLICEARPDKKPGARFVIRLGIPRAIA